MKEIAFADKVYKKLVEMETGVEYDLMKKVSQPNREEFVHTVKDFIRYDHGKAWGFYIEFTNDYSRLYKKEY